MFRKWTEILPVFLLRKIALRRGERLLLASHVVVQARPDVLFIVPPATTPKARHEQ